MKILCSKCGAIFESLIVDKKEAWKELQVKSTNHVMKKHKGTFELLAKGVQMASMALASIMHNNEFVIIPEDEKFPQEAMEFNENTVMMAIGYDYDEDEEDEVEEDKSPEIRVISEVEPKKGAD